MPITPWGTSNISPILETPDKQVLCVASKYSANLQENIESSSDFYKKMGDMIFVSLFVLKFIHAQINSHMCHTTEEYNIDCIQTIIFHYTCLDFLCTQVDLGI